MKASAITLELLTPQIESFQAMHAIRGHSSVTQRRWGWGGSDFLEKIVTKV